MDFEERDSKGSGELGAPARAFAHAGGDQKLDHIANGLQVNNPK
jgi:hypothetical protein